MRRTVLCAFVGVVLVGALVVVCGVCARQRREAAVQREQVIDLCRGLGEELYVQAYEWRTWNDMNESHYAFEVSTAYGRSYALRLQMGIMCFGSLEVTARCIPWDLNADTVDVVLRTADALGHERACH